MLSNSGNSYQQKLVVKECPKTERRVTINGSKVVKIGETKVLKVIKTCQKEKFGKWLTTALKVANMIQKELLKSCQMLPKSC